MAPVGDDGSRLLRVECVREPHTSGVRCCGLTRRLPGLVEIRDNPADRIAEAEYEGWLGEVELLAVSLEAAKEKIRQLEAAVAAKTSAVHLGTPSFGQIAGQVSPG